MRTICRRRLPSARDMGLSFFRPARPDMSKFESGGNAVRCYTSSAISAVGMMMENSLHGMSAFSMRLALRLWASVICFSFPIYSHALDRADWTSGVAPFHARCSWVESSGNTVDIKVAKGFYASGGAWGFDRYSRGILIFTLDRYGNKIPADPSGVTVQEISYGNFGTARQISIGTLFFSPQSARGWVKGPSGNIWSDFKITINKDAVSEWPGVIVHGAVRQWRPSDINSHLTDVDPTGTYIGKSTSSNECELSIKDGPLPPKPPPLSLTIDVTTPDWNLGELPRGNGVKTFSNNAEQLCFTYLGPDVSSSTFVINAGSANGVVNHRYRLRNLNDASQFVPYTVTLDSGSSKLILPNLNNSALSLDNSGKTCFVPTFNTTVDSLVDDGDYDDVLTFTVVTKP